MLHKFFQFRSSFKAFTLAEVLITLLIVGVVAALTVPVLISNYQKNQTAEQLKKAYSTFANVINKATVDYGEVKTWNVPTSGGVTAAMPSNANTYFVPYLSIAKNCGYGVAPTACTYSKRFLNPNDPTLVGPDDSYEFFLNDGSYWQIYQTGYSALYIYIDVNGMASPNKLGRDVFFLTVDFLTGKYGFYGIVPTSFSRNTLLNNAMFGCSKTVNMSSGVYCGALIQKDGWQIADDYPW